MKLTNSDDNQTKKNQMVTKLKSSNCDQTKN